MAGEKGDLLIGNIALKEELITREQLYDCLVAQERNPSKSLGAIMVSRGYLTNEDMQRVLELQKRAFEAPREDSAPTQRSAVLGKILMERGLVTEYRLNECLRLQGRMSELGIRPVPQLGEIMIRRGYLDKEAVENALRFQNLTTCRCPECGSAFEVPEKAEAEEQSCPKCQAKVTTLVARIDAAMRDVLDNALREHDVRVPEEVRSAMDDPTRKFGKYLLLREIGRGGAGIVYKAWQQDLNKVVALKVLPHESDTGAGIKTPFGDMEDVKRFFNETKAHAEINHPNVVPILDFGRHENHFFYTMQYISGITLDGVVREGLDEDSFRADPSKLSEEESDEQRHQTMRIIKGKGMPLRMALGIIRDVALAVENVHQHGVYHRDIKPGNILIDWSGKPWLMDFGLAKVTRLGDSAYVKGVVMGTPHYMPPEQAAGDMEQVDHLSDIYSLGAVLYELVGGQPPFSDKSAEKVLEVLTRESPESVRTHVPDLPEPLVIVIEKAMARDPQRRYLSAKAFAEDLDNLIAKRPLNPDTRASTLWDRVKSLFSGRP